MPDFESTSSAQLLVCSQNAQSHWKYHLPLHGTFQPITPKWKTNIWYQDLPANLLQDAYEIVPCLSVSSKSSWGYQCTLEYETDCGFKGSCDLMAIGWKNPVSQVAEKNTFVQANIDFWIIKTKIRQARIRWVIHGLTEIQNIPALFSISSRCKAAFKRLSSAKLSIDKIVPSISQMLLNPDIKNRICSPTCLGMLIKYHGISINIHDIIAEAYHAPTQLYGVWPANIRAASLYGLCGYVSHIPNWRTAENLIQKSYPFIASIRYKDGELSGAPIEETSGHLVIVRGCNQKKILVNDPASPTEKTVARSYCLEEFRRAWFNGSSVAYILFPQ